MRFEIRLATSVALTMLSGAAGAAAGPSPYSLTGSETVTYDSNVYRAPPSDTIRTDLISSTNLAGGVDQSFSRWRLVGNGSVQLNRYQRNDALDNTGYGVQMSLQGSTIERLSGSIDYGGSRSLTSFSVLTANGSNVDARLRVPSLQTAQQIVVNARLGLASVLALDSSATHRSTDYSASAYAAQENSEDVGSLGLAWNPGSIVNTRVALRHAHGRYPNGIQTGSDTYLPDAYNRNDVDLTVAYAPSGATRVDARLSFSRQHYRESRQRDFSSVTGLVDATFHPTGKLTLTAALSRDTGNESTFYKFNGSDHAGLSTYNQLADQASLNLLWDATAKLKPSFSLAWLRRRLVNDFTLLDIALQNESGSDRLLTTSVALHYAPTRSLAAECALRRERRTTNTGLSYPYVANGASCVLSFTVD